MLGFGYLCEGAAFLYVRQFPSKTRLMQELYPHLAEKFSSTPVMVDRAVRHAVEACWKKGSCRVQREYFGYCAQDKRGMPTNGEFLFVLYERVKLSLQCKTGEGPFKECMEKTSRACDCGMALEDKAGA